MSKCKKCSEYELTNDEGLCLNCARRDEEKIERLYDDDGIEEFDCPMPTLCNPNRIEMCYNDPERRCGLYTHEIGGGNGQD